MKDCYTEVKHPEGSFPTACFVCNFKEKLATNKAAPIKCKFVAKIAYIVKDIKVIL